MRLYAISDLHTDKPQNQAWVESLPLHTYAREALLVAGDVHHNLEQLGKTLSLLRERFAQVFFVPGNHDVWIHAGEKDNSLTKFEAIVKICDTLGVQTGPGRVGLPGDPSPIWIVPLFSWYCTEGPDSLHAPKVNEVLHAIPLLWADTTFVRWPESGFDPGKYFLSLNERHLHRAYDAPVITFSHFLPHQELLWDQPSDRERPLSASQKGFNFSRVAGDARLDAQIRTLGAVIHVYGHQHRNRYREIDGVTYLSHCLGYPYERQQGLIQDLERGAYLVWDTGNSS
jgi:predicted phosphodiesterase